MRTFLFLCAVCLLVASILLETDASSKETNKRRRTSSGNAENAGSFSSWFHRDTTPKIMPKPFKQSLSTSNQGHQRSTAAATSSSASWFHRDTTPKIMPKPVKQSLSTSNQGHQRSTAAATSAFSPWSRRDTSPHITPNPSRSNTHASSSTSNMPAASPAFTWSGGPDNDPGFIESMIAFWTKD